MPAHACRRALKGAGAQRARAGALAAAFLVVGGAACSSAGPSQSNTPDRTSMPVTATATINENPDDQFYEAMVVTGVISQMGRPVGPGVIRALVDGFAAPCGAAEVHGDGSYTMKT